MLLVMVKRDPNKVPDTVYGHITRYLRQWTAEALSVSGTDGELTPKDVDVWSFEEVVFDQGSADLRVVIFANNHPERAADLDERQERISRALATFLKGSCPNGQIWVSVRISLQDQVSFGKFQT